MRVSSTSSHACSSRPPRESSPSRALPMAVLLRASRARSRASRPRADSGRSTAGAVGSSTRRSSSSSGSVGAPSRVPTPARSPTSLRSSRSASRSVGGPQRLCRGGGADRTRQLLATARAPPDEADHRPHEDEGDDDGDGNDFPDLLQHGAILARRTADGAGDARSAGRVPLRGRPARAQRPIGLGVSRCVRTRPTTSSPRWVRTSRPSRRAWATTNPMTTIPPTRQTSMPNTRANMGPA